MDLENPGAVYERRILGLISLAMWTSRSFDADEGCDMENHHLGRQHGFCLLAIIACK